jgi:hypothetical protein
MKIGLIIPCTSKKRNWDSIKESYIYNYTLKTFIRTCDKEHEYIIYIGYDNNDRIFSVKEQQNLLKKYSEIFLFLKIEFIEMNAPPGHLTKMWNDLYKVAYDDGCDYFYQCGDDIDFKTNGWINMCIQTLMMHNNIGLTGPYNNNRILTQAFVSREHMNIFGYFFPENILNWCCDDWYNWVYQPNFFFPLMDYVCINMGGEPRYVIDNNPTFKTRNFKNNLNELREKTYKQALEDRCKITKYLDDLKLKN